MPSSQQPVTDVPTVPRPKQYARTAGKFLFHAREGITCSPGSSGKEARKTLCALLEKATGITPRARTPRSARLHLDIVSRMSETDSHPEGFRIAVTASRIRVSACTDQGLFYGVHALLDLVRRNADGTWSVPACDLVDWPDFTWRGLMIDPARKFIPMERIRVLLDHMARARMNRLHIHFSDNQGFTVQSKAYPRINERLYHPRYKPFSPSLPFSLADLRAYEADTAGVYSHKDITSLVRYAAERNITIVPEFSWPSHSAWIIRAFPDLACRTGKPFGHSRGPSPTVACIGNENIHDVIRRLFDEILPLFPSPWVHTGGDEIDCRKVTPWAARSWDRCEVCRQAMRQKHLAGQRELFYDFVEQVRRAADKHGKRLIMWNDYVDIAKPVPFPRDMMIQFWRVSCKAWPIGPSKGCSLARFLREGFPVINSWFERTYIDGYIRDRDLAAWSPDRLPPSPGHVHHLIQGGEMCAWDDHEYYPRTLPSAIPFFADRLWNRRNIVDLAAFSHALARHLFGPALSTELETLYESMGSVIPPLVVGRTPAPRAFHAQDRSLVNDVLRSPQALHTALERTREQLEDPHTLNRDALKEVEETLCDLAKTQARSRSSAG